MPLCDNCCQEFTLTKPTKRYCSNRCTKSAYRKRRASHYNAKKSLKKQNHRISLLADRKCRACEVTFKVLPGDKRKFSCSMTCKIVSDSIISAEKTQQKAKDRMAECLTCLATFPKPYKSQRKYCSESCHPTSALVAVKVHKCLTCIRLVKVQNKYCPPCREAFYETTRGGRTTEGKNSYRRELERNAPGTNQKERRIILARWKAQGLGCTYCPNLADTLDHIVPLSRGGTNYEGNLTPACRRCNSSKADKLLSEWTSYVRATA